MSLPIPHTGHRLRRLAVRFLPHRARPVLLAAACLGVLALGLGTANWVLSNRGDRAIAAIDRHLVDAEGLLSAVKDIETAQRGFALAGDDIYLEPYDEARAEIDRLLPRLEGSGLPIGSLRQLAGEKITWSDRAIAIRRQGGLEAALRGMATGDGRRLMEAFRTEVERVEGETRSVRAMRVFAEARRSTLLTALTLLALCLAVLSLGLYALARRRGERRATALLDGVMAHAPIGLGFLDRWLRLDHGNKALGMLGGGALANIGGNLPEEVADQIEAHLAEVLRSGRPKSDVEVAVDAARGRPARRLLLSLFRLDSAAGALDGVGIAAIDVTARHRMEARLRRSEARMRLIIDSVPQLAWMTNEKGEVQWYNRRWLEFTGTPSGEPSDGEGAAKGSGWSQVHPDHEEGVAARFQVAVDAGEAWEDTFPLRGNDGGYRWFLSRALPLRDVPDEEFPDGRLIGWFGTNTDITEMREAEEALSAAKAAAEDANMAKSQFIANMSHELRTPLSAVIGYSEMLEEEAADLEGGEVFREDLGKININARHLLSLINDVLDLSKIEAGKMEVQPEAFDTAALLEEVAGTVGALVAKKNNTLSLAIEPGLPGMYSDPMKLRQCLFNLLGNAAKFTEGGGISLSAATVVGQPGWLVLRVADTGIGMTAEQLARLFQRFTQADATTTRRFGGTGLGLAITKAFATMLGGRIEVDSRAGEGTTFTIHLPIDLRAARTEADDPGVLAGTNTDEAAPGERGEGLVLVVDDDSATRDLLARFLTREGFAVRTAADGQNGLRLARELRPDAILLDVMMPRLDGWGVLSALKRDPELAGTPVVMLTVVQERGLAFSLGAADYLNKPVEWSRLKQVLARYRAQPVPPGIALLVEQDEAQRTELRALLEREGWRVEEAADHQAALARIAAEPGPTMLLVEVQGGDGGDGLALIQDLRQRPELAELPIIALADADVEDDKLRTLRGEVDGVMPVEHGIPEGLVAELRRIAAEARAAQNENREKEGTTTP